MRNFCGFYLGKAFAYCMRKKPMKQYSYFWLTALVLSTMLTSCDLVEGIFKAGFYAAFIVIILVVVLIVWVARRFRR